MEKYNKKKLRELLQKSGKKRVEFRKALGSSKCPLDDRIAINYINGGDLLVSKLLLSANFFGVSIKEFFLEDGMPGDEKESDEDDESSSCQHVGDRQHPYKELIEYQIKLQHQQEIARIREEYWEKIKELEVQLAKAQTKLAVLTEKGSVG